MKLTLKPIDRTIYPVLYRTPSGKKYIQCMGWDIDKLEIEVPDGSVLLDILTREPLP